MNRGRRVAVRDHPAQISSTRLIDIAEKNRQKRFESGIDRHLRPREWALAIVHPQRDEIWHAPHDEWLAGSPNETAPERIVQPLQWPEDVCWYPVVTCPLHCAPEAKFLH